MARSKQPSASKLAAHKEAVKNASSASKVKLPSATLQEVYSAAQKALKVFQPLYQELVVDQSQNIQVAHAIEMFQEGAKYLVSDPLLSYS